MRSVLAAFVVVTASVLVLARGQAGVTLTKASLAAEIKTDQRTMIAPEAGKQFLWVSTKFAGAQTIDLTKVALKDGPTSYPLAGVDSAFGGDPSQFSMTMAVHLKTGKTWDPLEETRSDGSVAFAFTPGKVATLKIIAPPQSVCLLFVVPQTFKTGAIAGLGPEAKPLPALSK